MSTPPKEPKYRVSFSKNDLCLIQSYLSRDLENIIENAPLLADIQKAIRKIEFQILEPSHSAAPKALSHSFDKVIEKARETAADELLSIYNSAQETLSSEQIILVLEYKSELGDELNDLEKQVLNEAMMKKMGL